MYKNFKNVEKVVFGRGSFNQLEEILKEQRQAKQRFITFIIDSYFKGKYLEKDLPHCNKDIVFFIDVDTEEPTTSQVDEIRDRILEERGIPACVVGIGGGSVLDIAKAVALMMTNKGSSALYQGLNLIKQQGVYHLGIPTVSGTGAECSMTAVLTGPKKKLGLKCDWTVFNQIILDPNLTATVPLNQWFYTGMDCYIHCIEAQSGIFYNAYSKAYADQALQLCREVFLFETSGQNLQNDEKLMLASLFGGLSLTYSEVGACHALSYGLSKVLQMRHGFANCITFNHLDSFYGDSVKEFKQMIEKHNIYLPHNLSTQWSEEIIAQMAKVAYKLPHMWTHALGHDWKEKWSEQDIIKLYQSM